jgi:tripartite-type tricarboxylate transporter receptor subunit TctC
MLWQCISSTATVHSIDFRRRPHFGALWLEGHATRRKRGVQPQLKWFRPWLFFLLTIPLWVESPALGQAYPVRPVKFITSQAAGSGTNPAMRILTDRLGKLWGQQTVLVDEPGAGGVIAARTAASAAPDGYTLLMAVASTYIVLPESQSHLPFNVNEFVPIGFVGEVPIGFAVSPGLPVNSLAELIEFSKRQPGELNVALGLRGGLPHLATEMLRTRSGADLTALFYPGTARAMTDVLSGRVPVVVDGLAGPISTEQVKLLAIASSTRIRSHPNVPTVSETIPGFTASGWFALVAPPATPNSIVRKVSDDLRMVLSEADLQDQFNALNLSTRSMSPQQLVSFIHSEQQLWEPIVKQIGLTAQ